MLNRIAGRVVRLQVAIAIAGSALWWLADGTPAALAALAGGGGSALLSFHFAVRMFARNAASDPKAILGAFYRAEAMKLIMAVALIFIGVLVLREQAIALITTFAATLSAYWLALLRGID